MNDAQQGSVAVCSKLHELDIAMSLPLWEPGPPRTADTEYFYTRIHGRVLCSGADENRREVGYVSALLVHHERWIEFGQCCEEDLFDDAQEHYDSYAIFRKHVDKLMQPSKYLFLDRMELHDTHRGDGLGLEIMAKCLMEYVDDFDAVAILVPAPLACPSYGSRPEKKNGQRRLKKYWSQLGFKQLGNSSVMAYSTIHHPRGPWWRLTGDSEQALLHH